MKFHSSAVLLLATALGGSAFVPPARLVSNKGAFGVSSQNDAKMNNRFSTQKWMSSTTEADPETFAFTVCYNYCRWLFLKCPYACAT
jgi:hypothetical protein